MPLFVELLGVLWQSACESPNSGISVFIVQRHLLAAHLLALRNRA